MATVNTEQYNQLKKVLRQMFQLDQADLDFGIYRIMNQKRIEINAFLDDELLIQIHQILQETGDPTLDELKLKLKNLENTLQSAGVNPDENDKVQELRAEYAKGGSLEAMELEVYSRLTQFFKRYYKEGDFISQRRYKEGVYAIPYEGEEVKLHWANHDQYYIKTGEYFKNYSFKVGEKSIHFVLKEADTERDNNKAQSENERRFKLYEEDGESSFEETKNGELNIFFTYEPTEKRERQNKLNEKTLKTLTEKLPGKWTQILLQKKPTEKNKNRTLLEYRLTDYTAKNTFDYFIHKDLGKFLRQELDFYIKNEILNLDDIDLDNEQSFQKQLTLIKALKKVALKIITFLAQLEDFQKKLFLKKKMVLQSDYCITLDRVDESFYEDISKNKRQLQEWEDLFAIDDIEGFKENLKSKPVKTLRENPYLLMDTQFFSNEWKYNLLATIPNLDEQCDGLLINSENFQALNLLQKRYDKQIKTVYIDPPYNAKFSEIVYKNNYKHSSWLSLMDSRISLNKSLLKDEGVLIVAIDENEQERLGLILSQAFPEHQKTCISIIHNPGGIQGNNFSYSNDFAYFIFPQGNHIKRVKREESNIESLRDWGDEASKRGAAKNCFYPIYVDEDNNIVSFGEVCEDDFHPEKQNIKVNDNLTAVYPIDDNGVERKWRYARHTVENIKDQLLCKERNGVKYIQNEKSFFRLKTVWDAKKYNSNIYGSKILNNIIGSKLFDYPKSIHTVEDSVFSTSEKDSIILDYFAGSGTTAHAVINLNREDNCNGKRKYILVEMGEYFNTVTKPRIQKVIYSDEWEDGKPITRIGSSHCFKYMRLESYEDTLNNLYLKKGEVEDAMREEYLLNYSLDVESRDSLLMLDAFKRPFGYKIKSTENNELKETDVDLVETFNYLIGLQVMTMEIINGYVVVTGETLDEKQILVIWRDIEKHSNADLNEFISTMKYNPLDDKFDHIYVNGDNNIEVLKTNEARWKVRMIELEFHKRIWELEHLT